MKTHTETRPCKVHGDQPISDYYYYQVMDRGKLSAKYECKLCSADKRKKRYAAKKDWYNDYGRQWQKDNKSKTLEYKR